MQPGGANTSGGGDVDDERGGGGGSSSGGGGGGGVSTPPQHTPTHHLDPQQPTSDSGLSSPLPSSSSEIFHSQLDASEINFAMFRMPTSYVAKRLAIFDSESDGSNPVPGPSKRQSVTPVKVPSPTDASDGADGEEDAAAPHPLNQTLDHRVSEEELSSRKLRVADQMKRLSRNVSESSARAVAQRDRQPLLICMVGVPARGKTYASRRIMRYLAWLGVKCQVFNVAIYRRKNLGYPPADFFNFEEEEEQVESGGGSTQLLKVFEQALDDTYRWLLSGVGQVAIFDGTNHTRLRRLMIRRKFAHFLPSDRIIFIEMSDVCGGAQDVITQQAVARMPEYQGRDAEGSLEDFRRRMVFYERSNQPVTKDEGIPFVRYGKNKLSIHHINGYLSSRIAFLLMNLRVMHRTVYLCLTSEDERPVVVDGAGSDCAVSEVRTPPVTSAHPSARARRQQPPHLGAGLGKSALPCVPAAATAGSALKDSAELRTALEGIIEKEQAMHESAPEAEQFARSLVKLLDEDIPKGEKVTVWSTHDAAGTATVRHLLGAKYNTVYWRYLGEFGFSVVQKMMGETYEDIIERLEPIIFEIERCETHLLICGHPRVTNALYGYLSERGIGVIQPRTVVKLQPRAYDIECHTFSLQPNGVLAMDPATAPVPATRG
eukprot:Rhum_TRINITY_DN14282_c33_g1::Rhum_TRINITY_DN14282_c33_g1_i1::g.79177::m.79177